MPVPFGGWIDESSLNTRQNSRKPLKPVRGVTFQLAVYEDVSLKSGVGRSYASLYKKLGAQ
jgi:hypothetical protein